MRRVLSEIMSEYLQDEDHQRYDFLPPLCENHGHPSTMPVQPSSADWGLSSCGRKLERKFEFPNINSRNTFVLDIMELEGSSGHHIDFYVTDSGVLVVLQTKDLGMVTDLDLECSRHLSACAVDVEQSRL